MQQWTLSSEADGGTGHGSVYFWSASADKYRDPGGYLDTLYNAGSLRGLFAGHTHHSRTFSFTNNSSIHVFGPAYKGIIGTITVSGS